MLVPLSTDSKEAKDSTPSLVPKGLALPFFLVTALFFLWGVPSNLNDVLIRQFMKSFAISRFQAGLVQSAFYMGYFLLAIPAALLMRKMGYKFGIVVGLLLFASGTFLFWPAALLGRYGFFLFALFVIASGLSFLETASNPFIAQLGSPESAARRLNFSQAFNPLGAICRRTRRHGFYLLRDRAHAPADRRHAGQRIPTTPTLSTRRCAWWCRTWLSGWSLLSGPS